MEKKEFQIIKDFIEDFFNKMTLPISSIEVEEGMGANKEEADKDSVVVKIDVNEPQILIGQGGQTLFEIQRVLRMALNKKIQRPFYLDLDINGYKEKKANYIKDLAKEIADQVSITKETKVLQPMPAYERRILHKEFAKRPDIISESAGDGETRHIIVKAK
jgi:spoIIIJ-associated protein